MTSCEQIEKETVVKMMKAQWNFMLLKHLVLACSRGETELAKMKLNELKKDSTIQDCEIEEIKQFIEKIKGRAKWTKDN